MNLAIAGVQKAATSTLFRMLVDHPDVVGGPSKEMRFFLDNDRDWTSPDYADYARVNPDGRRRWALDATPAYVYWPSALQRMRAYDPDMRLILSVRDPVERGFSQWAMERQRDSAFPDLRVAVRRFGDAPLPGVDDTDYAGRRSGRESLLARGLYGEQLARGLELFRRDQWCVLDFAGFVRDPAATMDVLTDFLGLERFVSPPQLRHRMSTPPENTGAAPTEVDVARLVDRYAEDLRDFERLAGLEVSHWPTARVLRGDLSVGDFTARLLAKLGLAPGGTLSGGAGAPPATAGG